MAADTAGQISSPRRRRAEVDRNRGAGGPQTVAVPPVGPPTYALLGNLPHAALDGPSVAAMSSSMTQRRSRSATTVAGSRARRSLRAYTEADRVGSLVLLLVALRGPFTESGGDARFEHGYRGDPAAAGQLRGAWPTRGAEP
jgi:hypothetical protein